MIKKGWYIHQEMEDPYYNFIMFDKKHNKCCLHNWKNPTSHPNFFK